MRLHTGRISASKCHLLPNEVCVVTMWMSGLPRTTHLVGWWIEGRRRYKAQYRTGQLHCTKSGRRIPGEQAVANANRQDWKNRGYVLNHRTRWQDWWKAFQVMLVEESEQHDAHIPSSLAWTMSTDKVREAERAAATSQRLLIPFCCSVFDTKYLCQAHASVYTITTELSFHPLSPTHRFSVLLCVLRKKNQGDKL